MRVIEQHIEKVRDEADEAWRAQTSAPDAKQQEKAQELTIVCIALWRATKDGLCTFPPRDRRSNREVARMLRIAEQAMTSVLDLANAQARSGAALTFVSRLAEAVREVRGIILMPTARQMAARDPRQRAPEELRDLLLQQVKFTDGRPLIPSDLAEEVPYPLDPEPVG